MVTALMLAFSMSASLVATITKQYVINRTRDAAFVGYWYNTLSSLTATVVLLIMNKFSLPSLFTIALGIVFGVVTALGQLSNIRALKLGPLSYTTVIASLSTMIPTLCGALIWGEQIVLVQWIGIFLMVGCFVLSVSSDKENKKTSMRWILFCGVLFLCSGGIGVMQKWHQNTVYKGELNAFLLIAFVFSTVYSAIGCICYARKAHKSSYEMFRTSGISRFVVILIIIGGVCIALNNKWNLYLSGIMDSAVFFPVVNGGGLVLTTLSAMVLFRERLSTKQWIGMLLGTVAVICLCNPFA